MAGADRSALLITGAGGMLGHVLCRRAAEQWPVVGAYRKRRPRLQGVELVQADLCQGGIAESIMNSVRPKAVIHTAALSDVQLCQVKPDLSEAVNVQAPARLAELCARDKISFVFTSTDLVFDGTQAPYDERAPVSPLSVYARHKANAEALVQQAWSDALVCRLPLLIGMPLFAGHQFCGHMLRAIHAKTPLKLFIDQYRTPVDTQSAAEGLLLLLCRRRGLIHLGGRQRVSRFELGLKMASAMGVEPTMIQPVTLNDLQLAAPKTADVSLDSRKAFEAGYSPLPLEAGVQRVVSQFLASLDASGGIELL